MRRLLLFILAVLSSAAPARADGPCVPLTFEDQAFTVCTIDLRQGHLALYNLDGNAEPYGFFAPLAADLESKGMSLTFAMNAGMYDDHQKPIGLYVEDGRELKKINRRNGGGNFHLKPNGVFYIKGNLAGVIETEAYVASGLKPDYASQSGPMLVIDGAIHPKFAADGTSFKRRNGVGSRDAHTAIFVISEDPVNFYALARLFRDRLKCRNALFFDGTISSLYAPGIGRNDGFFPLGPIVGLSP